MHRLPGNWKDSTPHSDEAKSRITEARRLRAVQEYHARVRDMLPYKAFEQLAIKENAALWYSAVETLDLYELLKMGLSYSEIAKQLTDMHRKNFTKGACINRHRAVKALWQNCDGSE